MKGIVQKCLVKCDELKASVIAFPALGTGNLKYPARVVADIMISTITEYFKANNNATHIKTVKLVIYLKDDYQEFCKVYTNVKLLADKTDPFSMPKITPVNAYSQATDSIVSRAKEFQQPLQANAVSPQRLKSNTVDSYSIVGTVVVEFVQGDITDDASDVIVNPTNEELCLSSAGQVSNAIRNKGGSELQIICDNLTFQGYRLKSGMVCPTNSTGSLKCKKIFHINAHSDSLPNVVFACLQQAELSQLASIAFPAIGTTGTLGYHAAQFLCQPVIEFAQSLPKHVKNVRFVIFQKDMVYYFKQVFQELQIANLSVPESSPSSRVVKLQPRTHLAESIPKKPLMELRVFADDVKKAQRTKDCLQQLIDKQLDTAEMDISKLSSELLTEFKQEASFRNITVDFAQEKRQNFIRLKGDHKDVHELMFKINSALTEISEVETEQQKILSTLAKVRWQWEKEPDVFENYDDSLSYKLEQEYELNPKGSFKYNHPNGSIETFCFQQMRGQYGNDTFVIRRHKKSEPCKFLSMQLLICCSLV